MKDSNNNLTTKLYDKRDDFPFNIVNFPRLWPRILETKSPRNLKFGGLLGYYLLTRKIVNVAVCSFPGCHGNQLNLHMLQNMGFLYFVP